MRGKENLLDIPTVRLAALIEDQERLLELVRKEKAELVRMDRGMRLGQKVSMCDPGASIDEGADLTIMCKKI